MTLTCHYCGNHAPQVTGREVYPHRPDLYAKRFFQCAPCDATVGCHPDGRPLGRLANAELRMEKQRTHALFDPLWKEAARMYSGASGKTRQVARIRAYEWLADKMSLLPNDCHIGMFSTSQCLEARQWIQRLQPTPESIRQWAKARRVAA